MSIRPAITNDVSPLLSLVQGYYHDSPVHLRLMKVPWLLI